MDQQSSISSDLIRGHIDTIILYTLVDGDKFAQQITDAVEQKSDNEYKINQATLYSSLKRLENTKCVQSYWNDSDVGGRRKFFKLTEKGKKMVDDNLSNWAYSRSVIDKLMDCAPTPIYKTQYVDRIVEVPKEVVKEVIKEVPKEVIKEVPVIVEKPVEVKSEVEKIDSKESVLTENKNSDYDALSQNDKKDSEEYTAKPVSNMEINYKNILNGLIRVNKVNTDEVTNEPTKEPAVETAKEVKPEVIEDVPVKADFNKAIDEDVHHSYNGKLDFSDLSLKAAKEGFKLRVSSKFSYMTHGTLLINRVNLCSSLIIYLIALLEFLCFGIFFKSTLNMSTLATFLTVGIMTLYPVIMLIIFFKNPLKSTTRKIGADSILTAAIIVFNLIVITFASTLLFDFNYADTYMVLLRVVFPVTVFIDVVLYFVIRYLFAKSKSFHIIKK